MPDSDDLQRLEAERARLLGMITWENREPAESPGLGRGAAILALILPVLILPVLIPVLALVAASLMSNGISQTTLILGIVLAVLIPIAMIALFSLGEAAGEPINGTIGLLTTLATGISLANPLGPKNGEVEVGQRLRACEAQIAVLKNAR
ncbi:hypothetical protein [Bradyrhizobium prioriisuperbiae]|uniref:hypothetical protein n=1 Tax=Bradyrhizobium prioriisuperbiae TaxID=2854389 RepID=UPI0028E9E1DC|nr:hypothetical protein [Bradyrhizobium prioritasuperba]